MTTTIQPMPFRKLSVRCSIREKHKHIHQTMGNHHAHQTFDYENLSEQNKARLLREFKQHYERATCLRIAKWGNEMYHKNLTIQFSTFASMLHFVQQIGRPFIVSNYAEESNIYFVYMPVTLPSSNSTEPIITEL